MKYEIWFMNAEEEIVGEASIEAINLMHALSQIKPNRIDIPDEALTLSMQVTSNE